MTKTKGRKPSITQDKIDRGIEAIEMGLSYREACEYAIIPLRTFYDWMDKGESSKTGRYREFYDQVKQANTRTAVKMAKVIRDAAMGKGEKPPDWKAAAYWLERRFPKNWGQAEQREDEEERPRFDDTDYDEAMPVNNVQDLIKKYRLDEFDKKWEDEV